MKLALALLLVAHCPQSTSAYDAHVIATREAWAMDEALPADECGFPDVRVQRGLGVGGYHYANDVVINAGMDEAATRYAVRHETVHWLAWCTGYQAWGDPGHTMPELWGAGGVLARAEMLP